MKTKIIIGVVVAIIVVAAISYLFTCAGPSKLDKPRYNSCSQDSDCIFKNCACFTKKGIFRLNIEKIFLCGKMVKCMPVEECVCKEGFCEPVLDEKERVISVYDSYLLAGEKCDIDLANFIITEKSKEIVHFTCQNMVDEVKCYTHRDYEVRVKENTAVVYLTPFSRGIENPFFFTKEGDVWKLDLYKMSQGLVMVGSTCDSGWGWRDLTLRNEFCSYFQEGECPDNKSAEGGNCDSDGDCQNIDCSKYDKPGLKEGFKPYCVDNKCKCMCYGCE